MKFGTRVEDNKEGIRGTVIENNSRNPKYVAVIRWDDECVCYYDAEDLAENVTEITNENLESLQDQNSNRNPVLYE